LNNELQVQHCHKAEKLFDGNGVWMTLKLGHAALAYAQPNRKIRLSEIRRSARGLQDTRKLRGGDERLFQDSSRISKTQFSGYTAKAQTTT